MAKKMTQLIRESASGTTNITKSAHECKRLVAEGRTAQTDRNSGGGGGGAPHILSVSPSAPPTPPSSELVQFQCLWVCALLTELQLKHSLSKAKRLS